MDRPAKESDSSATGSMQTQAEDSAEIETADESNDHPLLVPSTVGEHNELYSEEPEPDVANEDVVIVNPADCLLSPDSVFLSSSIDVKKSFIHDRSSGVGLYKPPPDHHNPSPESEPEVDEDFLKGFDPDIMDKMINDDPNALDEYFNSPSPNGNDEACKKESISAMPSFSGTLIDPIDVDAGFEDEIHDPGTLPSTSGTSGRCPRSGQKRRPPEENILPTPVLEAYMPKDEGDSEGLKKKAEKAKTSDDGRSCKIVLIYQGQESEPFYCCPGTTGEEIRQMVQAREIMKYFGMIYPYMLMVPPHQQYLQDHDVINASTELNVVEVPCPGKKRKMEMKKRERT